MRQRDYFARIEEEVDGGWRWGIYEPPFFDDEKHSIPVNKYGSRETGWWRADHRLGGTTLTRWGARRASRRALRKLHRYLNRDEAETVTLPSDTSRTTEGEPPTDREGMER